MSRNTPKFGVDLITFYNPSFWNLPDEKAIQELSDRDPDAVWRKILDSAAAAGVTSLEVTFGPADIGSIRRAFGSATEFKKELDGRGMELKSAFYLEGSWQPDADRGEIADSAAAYARFIKEAGGDVLVAAPPMRTTWNAEPPQFNDFDFLKNVADIAHVVGRASLQEGVTTALHTEAHSSFCTARDVDLLMALTDPLFVSLCPDTGHLALSGGEPTQIVSRHRERVVISHWKDATGPAPLRVPIDDSIHDSHREYFRRVGAGSVDWFAWGRLMREIGFTDLALLELDAVADPVTEITAAREFIEQSLSTVFP
ncbi:sugar phosphate isomerase/epimerase family protein [Streptomyces sp. NBC_01180]|uniref:sugar phosphate isomerase/epimerase family protein n=1 Tax=Streptomyces sp. NBC_01180 TaxID=2903763 RepID=UPI00386AC2D0|nr:sugar phosphate isomerase/epimerase [Streptomyces sp. NBC_01180]